MRPQTTEDLCGELARWPNDLFVSIDRTEPDAIQIIGDGMVMYARFDIESETWITRFN